MNRYIFILAILAVLCGNKSFAQIVVIRGIVSDHDTKTPVDGASVRLSNSLISATTDQYGKFELQLLRRNVYQLIIKQVAYETTTKLLKDAGTDSTICNITLLQKTNLLESVTINAVQKPETLVGKISFSIYDFDFYNDMFLLLTAEKSLEKSTIRLADQQGNILLSWPVPASAGQAIKLFHDYGGNTELLCKDSIFRIEVFNNEFLISAVKKKDFHEFLEPMADSLATKYYWSSQSDLYPVMAYYYLNNNDSLSRLLKEISNEDLLKLYNLEYYYLPTRARLEADRMAREYKTDKHIIAAIMSGFTSGLYYEPLYSPLFVLNDTICIFNHHNDHLYHYDRNSKLIDSTIINYHHPKNWREWKKKLFVDEIENKVYALFSKDGHHYLKQINYSSGAELSTYKLMNHSATQLHIKDGYVYYIYRPFDSTQQKFLYREKIN